MNKTITKADIVQRLLNNAHITAEEAVVLLMTTEHRLERKESQWPFPNPYFPIPFGNPFEIKPIDNNKK